LKIIFSENTYEIRLINNFYKDEIEETKQNNNITTMLNGNHLYC